MTCWVNYGKPRRGRNFTFVTKRGLSAMSALLLYFPDMRKTSPDCPNRIREWRKSRRMTLAELAARVGTTTTQMSRMETGDRPVTIEWLQRIARPLQVTAGELLHTADNPLLPSVEETEILYGVREQGPQFTRTIAAMAEAHRRYIPEAPLPKFGGQNDR
jgi:transcriptional regulator with XRE-family HTH domain